LTTANPPIVSLTSGRDAYAGARARDDFRAPSVDAVRLADSHSRYTRGTGQSSDHWQQPPRETWTRVVHPEPHGTIPFLAQQIAQASSSPERDNESEAMPSIRVTARQAYMAARDSTVQFLSPTPLFDLRV
jgi:hypothetical protein